MRNVIETEKELNLFALSELLRKVFIRGRLTYIEAAKLVNLSPSQFSRVIHQKEVSCSNFIKILTLISLELHLDYNEMMEIILKYKN